MAIDGRPGTYVMLLHSSTTCVIRVGRWGQLAVVPGWYLYVGSAFGPGGLRARVGRHCRGAARAHWHVDHLRAVTAPAGIWYSDSTQRLEHVWAVALAGLRGARPVRGFGCSDCQCASHLVQFAGRPRLARFADAVSVPVAARSCDGVG